MSSEPTRRFPWVLTLLSGLALALLISLGVWQVQRLQWKQDLIARAEAAATAPPAPLAEVLASAAPEFRRVTADCPGLATAPFVELQSIVDGQAGVRLISACRPEGVDQTLLIDRGFVADMISARPPTLPDSTPVQVSGVLRATPEPGPFSPAPGGHRFYARDGAAMAAALGIDGPLAPWTLFADSSSNPQWAALRPVVPPPAFPNNHLGYAITWFGLAAALVAVYVALMRKRAR